MVCDSKLQTFPGGEMWTRTCYLFWMLLSLEMIPFQTCFSSGALSYWKTPQPLQCPKWENNRLILNSSFFLMPPHPIHQRVPAILNLSWIQLSFLPLLPPLSHKPSASHLDRLPQLPPIPSSPIAKQCCVSTNIFHFLPGHTEWPHLPAALAVQLGNMECGRQGWNATSRPYCKAYSSVTWRSWIENGGTTNGRSWDPWVKIWKAASQICDWNCNVSEM